MKWFKHETNSLTNLKLQTILDQYGLEAYGYYWACIELVGLQGEDFRVGLDKNWKMFLKKQTNLPTEKQDLFLDLFAKVNLIDLVALKDGVLHIPKMRERTDEYTARVLRKSEQTTDKVVVNRIDKNRTEQNIAKKDIQDVMVAFFKINPGLNFANKTERAACEWLIKQEGGLQEALKLVELVASIKGKEFAPTITSPYKLKIKYADLEAYVERVKTTRKK